MLKRWSRLRLTTGLMKLMNRLVMKMTMTRRRRRMMTMTMTMKTVTKTTAVKATRPIRSQLTVADSDSAAK